MNKEFKRKFDKLLFKKQSVIKKPKLVFENTIKNQKKISCSECSSVIDCKNKNECFGCSKVICKRCSEKLCRIKLALRSKWYRCSSIGCMNLTCLDCTTWVIGSANNYCAKHRDKCSGCDKSYPYGNREKKCDICEKKYCYYCIPWHPEVKKNICVFCNEKSHYKKYGYADI